MQDEAVGEPEFLGARQEHRALVALRASPSDHVVGEVWMGLHQLGQHLEHAGHALALRQPPHGQEDASLRRDAKPLAGPGTIAGGEAVRVDAVADRMHARRIGPEFDGEVGQALRHPDNAGGALRDLGQATAARRLL